MIPLAECRAWCGRRVTRRSSALPNPPMRQCPASVGWMQVGRFELTSRQENRKIAAASAVYLGGPRLRRSWRACGGARGWRGVAGETCKSMSSLAARARTAASKGRFNGGFCGSVTVAGACLDGDAFAADADSRTLRSGGGAKGSFRRCFDAQDLADAGDDVFHRADAIIRPVGQVFSPLGPEDDAVAFCHRWPVRLLGRSQSVRSLRKMNYLS